MTWKVKNIGKDHSQPGLPRLGDSELGLRSFASLHQRTPLLAPRRVGGTAAAACALRAQLWSTALAREP